MSIIKNGFEIKTLEEWEQKAGPKSKDHWADGRSAKEVARTWLESSQIPVEVLTMIASHSSFGKIEKWTAEPEAKIPFDSFAGEPRNSDLVVHAEDEFGPFVIAVEAKADEPFGELIPDALTAAVERYLVNNKSNGITRIKQLLAALFGAKRPGEPSLKQIRYQLLTACAGALAIAESRGCDRAVTLIHEFTTNRTLTEKHQANAVDLDNFVKRLSHGAATFIATGKLHGPFTVPGAPLFSNPVKLFLGKAVRDLR